MSAPRKEIHSKPRKNEANPWHHNTDALATLDHFGKRALEREAAVQQMFVEYVEKWSASVNAGEIPNHSRKSDTVRFLPPDFHLEDSTWVSFSNFVRAHGDGYWSAKRTRLTLIELNNHPKLRNHRGPFYFVDLSHSEPQTQSSIHPAGETQEEDSQTVSKRKEGSREFYDSKFVSNNQRSQQPKWPKQAQEVETAYSQFVESQMSTGLKQLTHSQSRNVGDPTWILPAPVPFDTVQLPQHVLYRQPTQSKKMSVGDIDSSSPPTLRLLGKHAVSPGNHDFSRRSKVLPRSMADSKNGCLDFTEFHSRNGCFLPTVPLLHHDQHLYSATRDDNERLPVLPSNNEMLVYSQLSVNMCDIETPFNETTEAETTEYTRADQIMLMAPLIPTPPKPTPPRMQRNLANHCLPRLSPFVSPFQSLENSVTSTKINDTCKGLPLQHD
jgi:hypothetical protein